MISQFMRENYFMIIISYDISNDKKRRHFQKFIEKFGHRVQYSVYEIENSDRILNNVITQIENKFMKQFDECDSVLLFMLSSSCKIMRYGYAKHEEKELFIVE